MLSCRHDLLFLFCLLLFYIFLPSVGGLCCVGVFGLIECSYSLPASHCVLQSIIIIIIIIVIVLEDTEWGTKVLCYCAVLQRGGA